MVSEDRVTVEEVLGRGRRVNSAREASLAVEKWPMTLGGFTGTPQFDVDEATVVASDVVSRVWR